MSVLSPSGQFRVGPHLARAGAGDPPRESLAARPGRERRAAKAYPVLLVLTFVVAIRVVDLDDSPLERTVLTLATFGFALVGAAGLVVPADLARRWCLDVALPAVTVLVGTVVWWFLWFDVSLGGALVAFPILLQSIVLRRRGAEVVVVLGTVCSLVVVVTHVATRVQLVEQVAITVAVVGLALLVISVRDENDRLLRALEHTASTDALTALATRRVLEEELSRLVPAPGVRAYAATRDARGTALVLVDLDGFKGVNDRYGHAVGDAALAHVAALVRSFTRAPHDLAARLGGDELAVVLPGCTVEDAGRRARDLAEEVRRTPLPLPDGGLLAVSVSVGLAHVPTHGHDLDALYATADAALRAAKRGGHDRAVAAQTS